MSFQKPLNFGLFLAREESELANSLSFTKGLNLETVSHCPNGVIEELALATLGIPSQDVTGRVLANYPWLWQHPAWPGETL